MAGLTFDQALDRLLNAFTGTAVSAAPAWVGVPIARPRKNLSGEERKALQKLRGENSRDLKKWWYVEMLNTPSPLTETMTLFWHNDFTSSLKKVKTPNLLYEQSALLRRHALGNFADLLRAVAIDPAMMVYLDTANSKAGASNENFARELMELFTLGEGQGYTEDDIREAARAFTGWRITPDRSFKFAPGIHDYGSKSFFGRTGRFDGNDIINILLEQPRVAVHITEKLWRVFVSEQPDSQEIDRLATIFRDGGYEIRPLMRAMLTSPKFLADANHGTLVKSPTDLMVGTMRLLGFTPPEPIGLVAQGRNLGQDLFDPPNVKGWPGGIEWINTAALPARYEWLRAISSAIDQVTAAGNRAVQLNRASRTIFGEGLNGNATEAFLSMPPALMAELVLPIRRAAPPGATGAKSAAGDLILDPVFQLK